MRIAGTDIDGVIVVDVDALRDERGSFARIWCADEMRSFGLPTHLAQCSISMNQRRGTLRGMHWQAAPHAETKIVRCTKGAIFDVALDLRRASSTYLKWFAIELSSENGRALVVPPGCAHGFQTLEDHTEVLYMMDVAFEPSAARGARWDDPQFGIEWPILDDITVSAADRERGWWT